MKHENHDLTVGTAVIWVVALILAAPPVVVWIVAQLVAYLVGDLPLAQ